MAWGNLSWELESETCLVKCKLFLKGLTIDKCEDFEVLYVIDEIIDIIYCVVVRHV